jgi:ubiquinone/menaquinone biosynthesis C-methylase UbiE
MPRGFGMKKEARLTKKIYAEQVFKEWKRLIKDPFHKLELDTTIRFLKKYLPKKGLILDAGGGPGRYTIELAKKGYEVVLLDFAPGNLELAKEKIKKEKVEKKVKEIVEGTITNLSRYKTGSFDAVLCLGGPLSHVHPEKERLKAISELVRVAKKGVPIFVSVMGKLGTITCFHKWIEEVKETPHFRRFYIKGDDYQWHGGKAFAHFFELEEMKSLFKGKVNFLDVVGLEGLATPAQKEINKMAKNEPKAWKNWLEMHEKLCTNPTVAEFSLHFMVIGRKK